MSQTTTPSGAACAHNWHDWKPGTVWCNRCQMVSARGNEGVPITGADVEIPKRRQYDTDPATDQPRGGCCAASRVDGWNECVESTRTAVAAVAALIAAAGAAVAQTAAQKTLIDQAKAQGVVGEQADG